MFIITCFRTIRNWFIFYGNIKTLIREEYTDKTEQAGHKIGRTMDELKNKKKN